MNRHQAEALLDRGFSRRQLGRIATVVAASAAMPWEYAMAQEAERRMARRPASNDPNVVRITSNENPMGPHPAGIAAMAKVGPMGWRYQPSGENQAFTKTIAEIEGVPEDHVAVYPGSSLPLTLVHCAFTSPTASWTMGNPGYGGGAPDFIGSKLVRVALKADHTHDAKAMVKADPNAGAYYICNPNNPTGTVTPRSEIDWLLANKKPEQVVVVDEAYIHYSPNAKPASDLVAAGKDVVVLRTFSKIYGMAGIRAGFALGRPDLLRKMSAYGGERTPVTGSACAVASMKVPTLIAERRKLNAQISSGVFEFFEKKKIKYIPSETNFFMMETGMKVASEFGQKMADNGVMIGRVWDAYPTMIRVTVGTQEEMNKFMAAVTKVMGA
jgi:histidinol-phosphate/aromatic aminotransferase/cobyric acid decarboxylase-like protein